jgi:hypothetical protein
VGVCMYVCMNEQYVCLCVCICMYVWSYGRMYACIHVYMRVRVHSSKLVHTCVCKNANLLHMHACMQSYMYACMSACATVYKVCCTCMHVCRYVCMHV